MGWVENHRCSRAEGPEELVPWVRKLNLPVGLSRLLGHTSTWDNYHTSPHPRGVHSKLAGDFSVRAKVTLNASFQGVQSFSVRTEFLLPHAQDDPCLGEHRQSKERLIRQTHAWLSCQLAVEFFILQGANILKD